MPTLGYSQAATLVNGNYHEPRLHQQETLEGTRDVAFVSIQAATMYRHAEDYQKDSCNHLDSLLAGTHLEPDGLYD